MRQLGVLVLSSVVLAGCQNMPDYGWPSQQRSKSMITKPKPVYKPATPVVIESQKKPVIKKETAPIIETPQEPVVVSTVPLIMKPATAPVVKKLADGRDMPAVIDRHEHFGSSQKTHSAMALRPDPGMHRRSFHNTGREHCRRDATFLHRDR
mgnify:CR=1 FL=1